LFWEIVLVTIFRRVDSCLLVLSRLAICRLGWQSLLVILDTSRFDQKADQLCCGCFWLWAKCQTSDVLQWCFRHEIL